MAESVSEAVTLSTKCYFTRTVCCILAFLQAASFQEATEVNTTTLVIIKRKVNQERRRKLRKHRKFRGLKKGGKGRTLKIEVQILRDICPTIFITVFDSCKCGFPVVKLCWELESKGLNVDVSQHLKYENTFPVL